MKDASILIVEDDGIIALRSMELLAKHGYHLPCPLASGEDTLEYLETSPRPDLILMDIGLMGRMDGIETARRIRSRYDIPVIFITAYSTDTRMGEAKELSPAGYLIKPFVEQQLLAIVRNILAARVR